MGKICTKNTTNSGTVDHGIRPEFYTGLNEHKALSPYSGTLTS